MRLTIKLFASFRSGRFEIEEREYPAEASIRSIIDELRIPAEEVGIVLVNGRHAELQDQVSAGSKVSIFPLLGGG